jgi:hypothetical protein
MFIKLFYTIVFLVSGIVGGCVDSHFFKYSSHQQSLILIYLAWYGVLAATYLIGKYLDRSERQDKINHK